MPQFEGLPWGQAVRLARIGSGVDEIVGALDVPTAIASDPKVKTALAAMVRVEGARARVRLRRQLAARASGKGRGSPITLGLLARNLLAFDRPAAGRATGDAGEMVLAATAGAEERLLHLLEQLADRDRGEIAAGAQCPRCSTRCPLCGREPSVSFPFCSA